MRAWICVSVVSPVVHTVSSGKYCKADGESLVKRYSLTSAGKRGYFTICMGQSNTVFLSKSAKKYKRKGAGKIMLILLTHTTVPILLFSKRSLFNYLNSQECFCQLFNDYVCVVFVSHCLVLDDISPLDVLYLNTQGACSVIAVPETKVQF